MELERVQSKRLRNVAIFPAPLKGALVNMTIAIRCSLQFFARFYPLGHLNGARQDRFVDLGRPTAACARLVAYFSLCQNDKDEHSPRLVVISWAPAGCRYVRRYRSLIGGF